MPEKGIYETFLEGLRKGWHIGTQSLLPNIMLAFMLIELLKRVGLLEFLGTLFKPVMALFGLPGEAITVLLSAWMSGLGGASVAASLFTQGILNGTQLTILTPAIFLMGAQIQYMGRILGVAGVRSRHYPVLFGICILNAVMAMLTMRYVIL